jgi:hypothetical protein
MIKLQFVTENSVESALIRWFSAGPISHVDVVLPDGALLGSRSRAIKISGQPYSAGVQIRPPGYAKFTIVYSFTLSRIQVGVEQAFYDWLKNEIGKPYDTTAVWGFASGRNWCEKDSWFCSELIGAGLGAVGIIPHLFVPSNKLTPTGLATALSSRLDWSFTQVKSFY